MNTILNIWTYILFLCLVFTSTTSAKKGDYVILLHGLGRTSDSMNEVAEVLTKQDYKVLNLDYASRKSTIESIVDSVLMLQLEAFCHDTSKNINLVTHSMGGIILRQYLSKKDRREIHRIVMLSPPNKGSEVVDFLKDIPGVIEIMGPAFIQLSADSNSFVNHIAVSKEEIGVITGNSTINFINSIIIPGPDDGKVAVGRAKLDEMTDFLVVNRSHPFIMNAPEVLDQIVYFLKNGFFKKDKPHTNETK